MLYLLMAIVLLVITSYYIDIVWREISVFHTFERDLVIAKSILGNMLIAGIILFFLFVAINKKVPALLIVLAYIDLLIFKSRYLYFISEDILS